MSALTTDAQAARAFRALRWRLTANTLRGLVAGSRLRLLMIAACSAIFWAGLFVLFFEGFHFLGQFVKLYNYFVEYLFGMFFLSLLIMLIASTGIIMYTGLFSPREAGYLLTTPAPADRIFAYKFLEAMAFSSWGFILLGSPMMVAYGITVGAPWPFYALFLGFLLAFVLIPGSLGGIGAILVANYLPRQRRTVVGLLVAGASAGLVALGVQVAKAPGEALSRDWLDGLLKRLEFSQHPLLPSRWLSAGLIGAAKGEWRDGAFYLAITVANAAMAYLLAAVVARELYRRGYGRVQGGRSARRRKGLYSVDAAFHRVFFFIARPIRLLILKDLRTFRRDPSQWSQFLIFFGLLAFYFVNIRRFGYDIESPYWRNLLSFLNLAVTALILSTFTSRFIFPMLSLEGRNFWVLGLFPLQRADILWGKFLFASGISLVATEGLIVLSDWMLNLSWTMIALHVGLVAILCLGLSGISVGLGAKMPNLKEDDPSKIAAGFGGTLNLLASLVFIGVIVGSLAFPCHVYFGANDQNGSGIVVVSVERFRGWLIAAMSLSLVVGVLGTVLPLRLGMRAFRRMEF